ncbi:glucosamine kinase [Phyllobacterium sp. CL33Tsu]|uniref:BadF/BadG/BcrA/BcrD ATPase family protein n=1 Tax=Phyllobacterium sp. CL33Tsu TaxID=1798191 RepID=UPI0008EAFED2|nr:BadF/BadG/BcrA/BcrD ATPase family protein [Phyllobacterium sp. CL33Tsu]SFJ32463.1 glucosamine kinase [Phyllobacterium sp. CL33Tsu]
MNYLVGIDGGGTSCRAALADAGGRILATGKSGSANIMTDMNTARLNILGATEAAFTAAGVSTSLVASASAVLGLAGANVGGNGAQLQAMLPFKNALVYSDGVIALQGALGDADGTVVIVGTGSVYVTRSGEEIRFAGGWGFKVSDLGGGARLGRDLLEETLLAYDGFHPSSALTDAVMRRFGGNPHQIVQFAHSASPGDFGTFAPMLFEYASLEDPVAVALIGRSVRNIEEGLDAVMPSDESRLSLLGGLGSLYGPLLSPRYKARLQEPLNDPLTGAVQLAVHYFSGAGVEHMHG